MPDIYRATLTVTGASPAAGDVTLIVERTSGTDCDAIYWEFTNPYPWHPAMSNKLYPLSNWTGTAPPCSVCISPQEDE